MRKLPTVRQAKDRSQASQGQSGKQRTVVRQSKDSQASTQPFHRLAPNIRILCTQPFPHTCTQMFYRHAPKIRIHAPKSFRIHAFNSACILKGPKMTRCHLETHQGLTHGVFEFQNDQMSFRNAPGPNTRTKCPHVIQEHTRA